MLALSDLKSFKVMFATPCYISAVSMNYVASVYSLALDCSHLGMETILHMHSESLITRGRNKMVIKFLEEARSRQNRKTTRRRPTRNRRDR